jgi:hypothetical protein
MEDTTNESQSRNAAKVAGGVAAIALVTTAAVKGVRFVGRKLKDRAPKHTATEQ